MSLRHKFLALVTAVLVLAGFRIGQQVYRWYAYAPERQELVRLEGRLESAALQVVATHVKADSLLGILEVVDRELLEAREALYGVGRVNQGGSRLSDYNHQVAQRNRLLRRWRQVLQANHATTDRYNTLADSIRVTAERMGEAFYPIRSPAEIAVRYRADGNVDQ